ncbi:NAD(P)H-hydrate dehydratase [Candidatus Woesearchaeota archaeon ex4484_78]|nr:MAG: NAD(P)H-hydrate dehydratase [Candidatus Woesearchaeota archaeon ex4484_78]
MKIKLKPRKKGSHKGQNGIVLVIGGSEDYIGAPVFVGLAALAVLRTGADLVYVAAPEKTAWAINCLSPDLITIKLKGKFLSLKNLKKCLELAKKADCIVIGNGIGRNPQTKRFVLQFLKKNKKPVIIDADALRMVNLKNVSNAVLTPHAGELKDLLKNSNLTLNTLQKNLKNNIIVIKGHPRTLIISKTKKAVNTTGHPGMTHGGSGDVLAGIIAGLIAQGNEMFNACRIATYINGKAGESLAKRFGVGYLASDLVLEIPKLLKRFQKII